MIIRQKFSCSHRELYLLLFSKWELLVTVDPTADTIVESNETVILTLASGTGYTVGTPNAATGTITDDDTSVTSQLSINDITVVEGKDNHAILTVTVDNPNPQPITFNYTTAPIDATADVDYTRPPAKVLFSYLMIA